MLSPAEASGTRHQHKIALAIAHYTPSSSSHSQSPVHKFALQHLEPFIASKRLARTIPAHPDRPHILKRPRALRALHPELVDRLVVRGVVPRARPEQVPLDRDGAHHRLLVARAHHDPVQVRECLVLRVVHAERATPLRRPEVVALQAQDEIEPAVRGR